MARWSVLVFAFFVACSSSKLAPPAAAVDPTTEPTIVGAVEEAVLQGTVEGEEAARVGRRIGRVAGVIAAIVSDGDVVDNYRTARDATIATTIAIGATHGAVEGAKRGYELDVQFAELTQISGIEATRPFPDLIDVRFSDRELLPKIAAVLVGREERAIDIEAAGNEALDVRDALIELGLPPASLSASRNDDLSGVALRISYR
jgi:hypothetical protein